MKEAKRAVLFDMDGLLVDTETLGIKVAVDTCKKLGITLSEQEKTDFIGITDEKFYRNLFAQKQLNIDAKQIVQQHFVQYEQYLHNEVIAFSGATTLPEILANKGYSLALVSGSTKKQIMTILQSLHIQQYFSVIIGCDDIATSKPNPEGYLLAAKKLGVSPPNCIVLEDAQSGIQAGKKAGMKVIGVRNKGMQDIQKADIQIETLTDLQDLYIIENLYHE